MSQLCESLPLDTRKHRSRTSDPCCPQTVLLFAVCRRATAISSCRPQFPLNLYTVKMTTLISTQWVKTKFLACCWLPMPGQETSQETSQVTSQDLSASMRTISHQTHVGDQALGAARGKRHTALPIARCSLAQPESAAGRAPSRCDPQEAAVSEILVARALSLFSSHAKRPVAAAKRLEPDNKKAGETCRPFFSLSLPYLIPPAAAPAAPLRAQPERSPSASRARPGSACHA
jgi:hypothetical protein